MGLPISHQTSDSTMFVANFDLISPFQNTRDEYKICDHLSIIAGESCHCNGNDIALRINPLRRFCLLQTIRMSPKSKLLLWTL